MNSIQYIRAELEFFHRVVPDAVVIPCDPNEVATLEALLPPPYRLPAAYRELLLYGGKTLGSVFCNVDFSARQTRFLLETGYEDIKRCLSGWTEDLMLPPEMFVLNEWLGSNFTFFKLNEGENPPVYLWEEGEGGLEVAVMHHAMFSDFLMAQLIIMQRLM